jgi:hypothetical protein
MPGNGARDPLDDWLSRGIQPLSPPDGAFEAVSRRARSRKFGKLAAVTSGVAAVAIGTVLAVPALLTPHTGTPVSIGSQDAGRTSQSLSKSAPPSSGTTGSGTPAPSATGAVGSATGATSPYPAGGPIPGNFQPTSVTFIGRNTGWAIGQAGTPGSCGANGNSSICTSVVLTQDGGHTWRGVPAPVTSDVSGIRFLNGQDGWAYGPQLWSTHDYGHTWQPVATGGKEVTDLETAGTQAFAVFASCSTTTPAPSITLYGQRCTDFTLETASAGSDAWTPIATSHDGASSTTLTMSDTGSGVVTKPTILLQGTTGWLVGPLGQVFSGSLTSGTWAQVSQSPCPAATTPSAAMLDWSLASDDLIIACNEQQSATVFSSSDGGATWTQQVTGPAFGTATSLTASPAAPDILATTDGIAALNKSGQWQEVSLPGGFSYVGMTSDGQGVAVPANADLHQVWMTYDGGLSWAPSTIAPQGA